MSIFREVSAKLYIDLPFSAMGRLRNAGREFLVDMLLRYNVDLGGVVMGFHNVKAITQNPFCYADSPFCHFLAQVDFLIFSPCKGCELPAVVTHVSSASVMLQVLDVFQGYVDMNDVRMNWKFEEGCWVKGDATLTSGDSVVVEVTDVQKTQDSIALNVKIIRKSEIPGPIKSGINPVDMLVSDV
jgi:hypothetical protein